MSDLERATIKAAVLKILNDRVSAAFKAAKDEVAVALGAEGRKNAVLDGHKLASVSVTKGGRVSVSNETLLTKWVEENYPTEVEQVTRVRPAFLDMIKKASEAAGEPCSPNGELDVPGISVGEPFPLVRKTAGADEIVEKLWAAGRLSMSGELKELG